ILRMRQFSLSYTTRYSILDGTVDSGTWHVARGAMCDVDVLYSVFSHRVRFLLVLLFIASCALALLFVLLVLMIYEI
ncbi:MAG: hypothetical protein AAFR64_14880, partial [Pseudomonadota bacterium]